jgi:hypothetical protein
VSVISAATSSNAVNINAATGGGDTQGVRRL